MARKSLLVSALMAGAFLGAPAPAALNFGKVSGVINQLHENSRFTANDFSFTVDYDGRKKTLFTGLKGLKDFYDLYGFNDWVDSGTSSGADSGSGSGSGGAFANWKPTFTGVGNYFGSSGGSSSGGTTGAFDNYKPVFTGVGGYFGQSNGASLVTGQTSGQINVESPPVPEPATWGMMIAGFGVIGMAMRRRKRATTNFA